MNLLSLLSAMLAAAFLIGAVYCLTRNRKSQLNVFSFLVLLLLGWWSFCNAFFFSAATQAQAWRWHHLASIGWSGFIAETTYYFIVLTGLNRRMKKLWAQAAFYALPVVLLAHNLLADSTSLAVDLVKSGIGNQWAYVNAPGNPWLWLYLVCLTSYFGFSFFLLLRWAAKVKHRLKRNMAIGFVALDGLTILLGFVTDVLSPLTSQRLPAVANLCTAVFGAGYFLIIVRYDLFNVRRVVEDRQIMEHSMEGLMVIDEEGEILDVNRACTQLLGTERERLIGMEIQDFFDGQVYETLISAPLQETGQVSGAELALRPGGQGERQLLISGAVLRDRKDEYMGTILSFRDITQLNELKERYKTQSEKYQRLALSDTLTGLPNRRKTFEYLRECEKNYGETGADFFILFMDLNDFKSVNDQFGHNKGDQFLKMAADRLRASLSSRLRFLGRLGGDEFLIVGFCGGGEESMEADAAQIRARFEPDFVLGEDRVKGGISVGYARYSEYGNIDDMVHHADEKMYDMKHGERASFRMRKG